MRPFPKPIRFAGAPTSMQPKSRQPNRVSSCCCTFGPPVAVPVALWSKTCFHSLPLCTVYGEAERSSAAADAIGLRRTAGGSLQHPTGRDLDATNEPGNGKSGSGLYDQSFYRRTASAAPGHDSNACGHNPGVASEIQQSLCTCDSTCYCTCRGARIRICFTCRAAVRNGTTAGASKPNRNHAAAITARKSSLGVRRLLSGQFEVGPQVGRR